MKIKKFIQKRFKEIRKHLSNFSASESAESLHQFRVEIKKLKALYLYINFIDPKRDTGKMQKPHKKIFRLSGKLRDIDVLDDLVHKYHITSLPAITNKSQRSKHIKKIRALIPSYIDSLNEIKGSLCESTKDISKKQLGKFLTLQEKKVKIILARKNIEKKLHKARKISKDIIYLSKLDKNFPTAKISFYNKLQDHLGVWHDKIMMVERLKESTTGNGSANQRKLERKKAGDVETIRAFSRQIP